MNNNIDEPTTGEAVHSALETKQPDNTGVHTRVELWPCGVTDTAGPSSLRPSLLIAAIGITLRAK